jgi:hypothetical protein
VNFSLQGRGKAGRSDWGCVAVAELLCGRNFRRHRDKLSGGERTNYTEAISGWTVNEQAGAARERSVLCQSRDGSGEANEQQGRLAISRGESSFFF